MTIEAIPGGVRLRLHLQPGASRNEVVGLHRDRLKLRVTAPPVDGRANEALTAWLAERCGVPRRQVRIVRGATSRQKTVEIDGLTVAEVRRLLG